MNRMMNYHVRVRREACLVKLRLGNRMTTYCLFRYGQCPVKEQGVPLEVKNERGEKAMPGEISTKLLTKTPTKTLVETLMKTLMKTPRTTPRRKLKRKLSLGQ